MCNAPLRFLYCLILGSSIFVNRVDAAIVTFNLLDPAGTAGTAGEAFEAGNSFTDSGLTIGASISTTLGSGTGFFSSNATTAGVNSDGIITSEGDSASEIDAGETLFLTLSFADALVTLDSIDFSGVGGGASDSADVAINGAALVSLFTGVADFNGTTDVYTPSGGISIASGDTFAFTAANRVALETISFDVTSTAVPEPSSVMVMAFVGMVGGVYSRRRKKLNRSSEMLPS